MKPKKQMSRTDGMTYWKKDHANGSEAIADDGEGSLLYLTYIEGVAAWNWVDRVPDGYYETTMDEFVIIRSQVEAQLRFCLIGHRPC